MVNERKYVKQHQLKKNRNSQAKIDVIQECPNAQMPRCSDGLPENKNIEKAKSAKNSKKTKIKKKDKSNKNQLDSQTIKDPLLWTKILACGDFLY